MNDPWVPGIQIHWTMIYAAGTRTDGKPFVYRASFDWGTGTLGVWIEITPPGLSKVNALQIDDGAEVYVADQATVWMSIDNGDTWQSRGEGLNGATVRALYPSYFINNEITGVYAATDQGILFGPSARYAGQWEHTAYTYTLEPLEMQFGYGSRDVMLTGAEGVFNLNSDLFYYTLPFTPTLP